MSMASSFKNKPVDNQAVFIGEVGLTGEVKPVAQIERRLKEIDRMGFRKAYVGKGNLKPNTAFQNLEVIEVLTVRETIDKCFKN